MEKCNFLKILQCPDFENLWGDSWHLFQPKKLDESDGGFCFLRIIFSSHVCTTHSLLWTLRYCIWLLAHWLGGWVSRGLHTVLKAGSPILPWFYSDLCPSVSTCVQLCPTVQQSWVYIELNWWLRCIPDDLFLICTEYILACSLFTKTQLNSHWNRSPAFLQTTDKKNLTGQSGQSREESTKLILWQCYCPDCF